MCIQKGAFNKVGKTPLPPFSASPTNIVITYQLISSVNSSHVLLVVGEQRRACDVNSRAIWIFSFKSFMPTCKFYSMRGGDEVNVSPIMPCYC